MHRLCWQWIRQSRHQKTVAPDLNWHLQENAMRSLIVRFVVTGLMLVSFNCAQAESVVVLDHATTEQDLLELTNSYFRALKEKDTATLQRVVLPGSQFTFVYEDESGPVTSTTTREELISSLPYWEAQADETLSDPQILFQGRIASLWSRYRYFSNGEFSHCGVDTFTFMLLADGWVISAVSWSVEKAENTKLGPDSC